MHKPEQHGLIEQTNNLGGGVSLLPIISVSDTFQFNSENAEILQRIWSTDYE